MDRLVPKIPEGWRLTYISYNPVDGVYTASIEKSFNEWSDGKDPDPWQALQKACDSAEPNP